MILTIEIEEKIVNVDYYPGSRGNFDHPEEPDSFEFVDHEFDLNIDYLKVLEKCRELYAERSL